MKKVFVLSLFLLMASAVIAVEQVMEKQVVEDNQVLFEMKPYIGESNQPWWNPFRELWQAIYDLRDSIDNLQGQIDNIELLPGPEGPPGPQGEPGPTLALETMYVGHTTGSNYCCPEGWVRTGCGAGSGEHAKSYPTGGECCHTENGNGAWAICLKYVET